MKKSPLLFLALMLSVSLSAQSDGEMRKNRVRNLNPGQELFSLMEVGRGETDKGFQLEVPAGILGFRVSLRAASADLRLLAGNKNSSKRASTEVWDEQLTWSRLTDEGFPEGNIFIAVEPETLDAVSGGDSISFYIKAEFYKMPANKALSPGRAVAFKLNKDNLFLQSYSFRVQSEKIPVSLRWRASSGTPRMLVNPGKPAWSSEDAAYRFSPGSVEQELLLGADKKNPLKRGLWFVTFISPTGNDEDRSSEGSLELSLIEKSAVALQPLKALPQARGNSLQGCMSATVGITTPSGTGFGAFVSDQGHVLTSLSAVTDEAGRPVTDISLLVSTSIDQRPLYLFKAKISRTDKKRDLALLEVVSAAYNRPVPSGFKFPMVPVAGGMKLEAGQPLAVIGFPVDSLRGEAGSVFALRSIVAGFEKAGSLSWFKSDALPGGGSGGIAVNVYYELVGVASAVKRPGSGIVTFFTPVSSLPSDWLTLIGR